MYFCIYTKNRSCNSPVYLSRSIVCLCTSVYTPRIGPVLASEFKQPCKPINSDLQILSKSKVLLFTSHRCSEAHFC